MCCQRGSSFTRASTGLRLLKYLSHTEPYLRGPKGPHVRQEAAVNITSEDAYFVKISIQAQWSIEGCYE